MCLNFHRECDALRRDLTAGESRIGRLLDENARLREEVAQRPKRSTVEKLEVGFHSSNNGAITGELAQMQLNSLQDTLLQEKTLAKERENVFAGKSNGAEHTQAIGWTFPKAAFAPSLDDTEGEEFEVTMLSGPVSCAAAFTPHLCMKEQFS